MELSPHSLIDRIIAARNFIGSVIDHVIFGGEVPLYMSNHYHREDFYPDPLVTPPAPVTSWPDGIQGLEQWRKNHQPDEIYDPVPEDTRLWLDHGTNEP
jgi:hypothetical protein